MKAEPTIRLLIPAAGKGKRSGLDYPKCLQLIQDVPIIVLIIQNLSNYVKDTTVIINPVDEHLFKQIFGKYNLAPRLLFQSEAHGMGDAILKAKNHFSPSDKILLTWSDIPFLSKNTVKQLLDCDRVFQNNFSFATFLSDKCYTIVNRNNGQLQEVLETKVLGVQPTEGEREIGLFIFDAEPIFQLLQSNNNKDYSNEENEHGFLYTIKDLLIKGFRVEGYPIARSQDILSFNTPTDLDNILKFWQKNKG